MTPNLSEYSMPPPTAAATWHPGQIRQRIAAGRFLNRLEREGKLTQPQLKAVRLVRAREDAFSDFTAGMLGITAPVAMAVGEGSPILDWLTAVGKWLWENREELIKFILMLVDLFS